MKTERLNFVSPEPNPSATYFQDSDSTLNSRPAHFCRIFRPCKRTSCNECMGTRRRYFVAAASKHAWLNRAFSFVTVSWPLTGESGSWEGLYGPTRLLLSRFNRTGEFNIWVCAFGGEKGTPHIHLLTTEGGAGHVEQIAHRFWPLGKSLVCIRASAGMNDIVRECGYLFDQNLIPTLRSSKRRARHRVISGTRGICYGFPKEIDWRKLETLLAAKNGHLENAGEVL